MESILIGISYMALLLGCIYVAYKRGYNEGDHFGYTRGITAGWEAAKKTYQAFAKLERL